MRPCRAALAILFACLAAIGPAAARPWSEMAESGQFVICAAAEDMPFSMRGTAPAGLYVDLGDLVARELGLSLAVRWVNARQHARRAQCDAVMGAAVLNAAPAGAPMRSVLTAPYMRAGSVLIAAQRFGSITSLDQLNQAHVAVPSGSWAHRYLDQRGVPVWVRFRNDREIIEAVGRGDADGGIVSNLAIGWHRTVHGPGAIAVLGGLLDDAELGFDVAVQLFDTDREALDRINAVLRARLLDGTIAAILARYGAPPAAAAPHG